MPLQLAGHRFPLCRASVLSTDSGSDEREGQSSECPRNPFDSVPNFLKLPPNLYLGEGIGVATNSKGHIFVYTRSQRDAAVRVRRQGQLSSARSAKGCTASSFAHAVRVDPQDNIWAVDEGSQHGDQVQSRRARRDGARAPAGADRRHGRPRRHGPPCTNRILFNRPTDVGWDAAGNIFVSDGYGNSRVVKYDKNGRFIDAGGDRRAGHGPIQSAAHDRHGRQGQRLRRRPQQQPHPGLRQRPEVQSDLRQTGAPWAVCITPGTAPVSVHLEFESGLTTTRELAAVTGEIYKMELDGTILGKFGKAGKQLGEFSTVHEIDCRNANELLVSEITAWRVQKIMLHPAGKCRLP